VPEKSSFKKIKKELKLKDAGLAEMFGYANAQSFESSRTKNKICSFSMWLLIDKIVMQLNLDISKHICHYYIKNGFNT